MRFVSLVLFPMSALMGVPGVTSELADPSSVQVGDEICFEGFVMDDFCIQLGNLMDVSLMPDPCYQLLCNLGLSAFTQPHVSFQ